MFRQKKSSHLVTKRTLRRRLQTDNNPVMHEPVASGSGVAGTLLVELENISSANYIDKYRDEHNETDNSQDKFSFHSDHSQASFLLNSDSDISLSDSDMVSLHSSDNSLLDSSVLSPIVCVKPVHSPQSFRYHLAEWASSNKIPHQHINSLLKIIKSNKPSLEELDQLPFDARALLKTPRSKVKTTFISPGWYYHFGVKNKLMAELSKMDEVPIKLDLLFGIDGLPISRSTGSQLYPILARPLCNSFPTVMVGLYHGYSKPDDANEFLNDVIKELVELICDGLLINNVNISIRVKGLVCDAPAKSFVLQVKGHSGFYSCTRCDVEGCYINRRVAFPTYNGNPRSHESFILQEQEEHHIGVTSLILVPEFDIIKNVPLDYMHLICLGVVKKLLNIWLKGEVPHKLPSKVVNDIDSSILSFKLPNEFVRQPRTVNEFSRWKATEFRNFLLYIGPVALLNNLAPDKYYNFLTLTVASSILLSDRAIELKNYASSLLSHFVDSFASLYGKDFISYNVHGLLHIADDIDIFLNLNNSSAFPFENYMQQLKLLIRSHDKPLQQIVKRSQEESSFPSTTPKDKQSFPFLRVILPYKSNVPFCHEYKYVQCKDYCLSCMPPNNFFMSKQGEIVKVISIFGNNDDINILGQVLSKKIFFEKPCLSSSICIYMVELHTHAPTNTYLLSQVKCKLVSLPFKHAFIVFPLLHTI